MKRDRKGTDRVSAFMWVLVAIGMIYFLSGIPGSALYAAVMEGNKRVEMDRHLGSALRSLDAGELDIALQAFETYIAGLADKEQALYRDISLAATKEEWKMYRATPDAEQGELYRRFWNRHDPAPLTQVNERLLEHYRRVSVARANFSAGKFPWDDRGRAYVQLGAPAHVSRSGDIRIEIDQDVWDTREAFATRLSAETRLVPGYPTFPVPDEQQWENWIYPHVLGGIELTFVGPFSNKYVFAPLPGGLDRPAPMDLVGLQGEMLIETARKQDVYQANFADLNLKFFFYPAVFRGEKGRSHLEFYWGLPASETVYLETQSGQSELELAVVFYDSLWSESARIHDRMQFGDLDERQMFRRSFLSKETSVDLLPGVYHMTVQVRDAVSGRSQVSRDVVRVGDYTETADLRMSDIELAYVVSPEGLQNSVNLHEGFASLPSRTFHQDQSAVVYFEIYNLSRDAFGQTHYRLEYTIERQKKLSAAKRVLSGIGRFLGIGNRDEAVKIAYEQNGSQPDESTQIELDLKEIDPGEQRVRIEITDLITESHASTDLAFYIVP